MIQTLAAASMVAVLMPNTFPSCSKSAAERRDSTPAGRFSQRKHFGGRAPHKCACFNLETESAKMLAVRWLVVRCVMYLFRLPNYRMTHWPSCDLAVW